MKYIIKIFKIKDLEKELYFLKIRLKNYEDFMNEFENTDINDRDKLEFLKKRIIQRKYRWNKMI